MDDLEAEVRAALAAATRTAYAHVDGEEPWETIDLFVPAVVRLIDYYVDLLGRTNARAEKAEAERDDLAAPGHADGGNVRTQRPSVTYYPTGGKGPTTS